MCFCITERFTLRRCSNENIVVYQDNVELPICSIILHIRKSVSESKTEDVFVWTNSKRSTFSMKII